MLESNSLSHRGAVRETNEDSYVEDLPHGIWIVADGVGGNAHGEVASQLATQTVERRLRQGASLVDAILEANQVIVDAAESNPDLAGMATTLVACRFSAGHYEIAWVGDSRAYLVNAEGMIQLTSDHNLANALYQSGEITRAQRESHQGQHELTQALGQLSLEQVPKALGELHDGDYLLLCTDGLSGVLGEQAIGEAIQSEKSLARVSERLLDQVLEAGAPDNVTFALIRYQKDEVVIHKDDFGRRSHRLPFDRRPYDEHCRKRPGLLLIILLSLAFIFFVL